MKKISSSSYVFLFNLSNSKISYFMFLIRLFGRLKRFEKLRVLDHIGRPFLFFSFLIIKSKYITRGH